MRRNFSSGETKASILTMPLPLIAGPRFTGVVYFSLTILENKDIDLRIIVANRGAEIKIPIAGHRSEVLAVRVHHRTKICGFRPFIALALAHPDLIMMSIHAVDRPIGNEEQLFSIRRKDRIGI